MDDQQSASPHETTPASRPRPLRRWVIIGAGVVLVAVAAGIIFWRLKSKDKDDVGLQAQGVVQPSLQKGLTPEEEKTYDTNPKEFDTDGDGLSDHDEIKVWKTDPKKVDTDGDDFGDGYEVINGYNPNGAGKLK